jgi:hypothetical protein
MSSEPAPEALLSGIVSWTERADAGGEDRRRFMVPDDGRGRGGGAERAESTFFRCARRFCSAACDDGVLRVTTAFFV